MLIAVGYLVGVGAVAAWIAGAVFANFGLIWGASSLGAWDVAFGQGVVSSLGMGLMMGAGFGVVVKLIASRVRSSSSRKAVDSGRVERGGDERRRFRVTAGLAACAVAACALIVCFVLGLRARARAHRGGADVDHHGHERPKRRADGHRPHGDLRPHRAFGGGGDVGRPRRSAVFSSRASSRWRAVLQATS